MTESRKKEIIERYLKNNTISKTSGKNVIIRATEAKLVRRESHDGSKGRVLTLRIKTDSESPVYEDWAGDKYTEIIGTNAYDESLEEVRKGERVVYSFADHDMDMKNIISSTQRDGTKLYKDKNNDYIMEMELDYENQLHRTIIELMENEEIQANSFIFQPEMIDIIIDESRTDIDYKVVQTKGKLLSVDPVIYPFYTQNTMVMKGKNMTEAEKKAAEAKAAEAKAKEEAEAKAAEAAKVAEAKAKEEAEAKAAEAAKVEAEAKAKEEAEAKAKEAEEAKAAEAKAAAAKEAEAKADAEFEEEAKAAVKSNKIVDLMDKDLSTRQVAILQKVIRENKDSSNKAVRNAILKSSSKGENMNKEELQKVVRSFMKDGNHNTSQIRTVVVKDMAEKGIELTKVALRQNNRAVVEKLKLTDQELGILAISRDSLTGDADQAAAQTGYAIIPTSTINSIIGEDTIAFREIEGAQRIPARGLEEVKVPISIGSGGTATALKEGEAAGTYNSSVVKTLLKLVRYSENFDYNPLLNEHAPIVRQKTIELSNRQVRAIQTAFYANLLTHAGDTFDSVKANYKGGITSDALIETETASTLTTGDLDNAILQEMNKTGQINKSQYRFYMKPATYKALVAKAKEEKQPNAKFWVIDGDVTKQGYDGIEVVTNELYTDGVANGKVPVVLKRKSDTVEYAGFSKLKDSVEVEFTKDMNVRQLTTRSQLKHVDPFYRTVGIKVKSA